MRRAMAEAEVGDDVYGEDPTMNRLQARAAEIFEREAALFVPSGSMGNLLGIMTQTRPGMEVICEERAHVNLYELASMSAIAGCMPRVIPAPDGILTWDLIEPQIQEKTYDHSQTGLIELENTHNMHGGVVSPPAIVEDICDRAHAAGIPVHLDGARIFNAAVALGRDVASLTREFDSVMFCLSKGLGAPVGSMLVGSRDFIERARIGRKLLGGGMRQAGVLAAAVAEAMRCGATPASVRSRRVASIDGTSSGLPARSPKTRDSGRRARADEISANSPKGGSGGSPGPATCAANASSVEKESPPWAGERPRTSRHST